MTYSMKIENSQKSIPKILFGTIYLAMRSNFNKSDKEERGERGRREERGERDTYYICKTFMNHRHHRRATNNKK